MNACLPRFRLGRLVATPGALEELRRFGVDPVSLVKRHHHGDWGELDQHDIQANEDAVRHGDRLLSAYSLRRPPNEAVKLWIVTEADRSATTILLPSEY